MQSPHYSRYECYKESGIDWLNELPEGWSTVRLGSFGRFFKGGGFSRSDLTEEGIKAVLYGDIYTKYDGVVLNPLNSISEETAANSFPLKFGDLLFAGSGETKEDIAKCVVFLGKERTVGGGDIVIFRPSQNEPRFLSYALNTPHMAEQKAKGSKGEIIVHAYASRIRNLRFPLPPLPEQRAIAEFLDGKCATIDEAVRIKEEQIRLLAERRQILIQNAVTRGLNPNARMKDSGIDWIGQIPAHWEVKRGKHLFREVNERSEEGTEELLSVSHTTGVTARSEKNVNMFLAEDYSGSKLCQPGDIVINTMWAWMGALGVSNFYGIISPSYGVYRSLDPETFNLRFLEWLLRTTPFIEQYNKISTGLHSSRLRLYPHMFLGLFMAFPSREEQDAIAVQMERKAEKIDRAISVKETQITALQEYKTCLVNAAVTGKIKVI